MKRCFALLASVAVLGAMGMLAPVSPANATVQTDSCPGTGNATLSLGLGYPAIAPSNLVFYTFTFTIGICAVKGDVSGLTFATGHVHGWCGHTTGSGVTFNGARYHHISSGEIMVVFGHLEGVAHVAPDPTTGSCLNKAATRFLVTGSVALQGAVLPGGCESLPPTFNCL